MDPEPFSGWEPDDPEPEGSGSLPGGQDGPGDEVLEGAEQGLFVSLPAEELTLAGFCQDGQADTMAPGPLLATVLHAVVGQDGSGLAQLSEDQLIGVISAARRLQSRAAWTEMAAMAEFATRRAATQPGFAADELAAEFRQPWQSAAAQIDYAQAVAKRLPRTFAALAAGLIHPVHLRIIEDETRFLTDADAAAADEVLAEAARDKSFGQLRYAAHRLVLKLDPESAVRRRAAALREAHVRRFREESGNAGMIAHELPSDEALASWQHVEQRALDLRAAGLPGTLQDLRVQAYLDLLQERDSRAVAATPDPAQAGRTGGSPPPGKADDGPGHPQDGPSLAALVTLTVPLAAWQGDLGAVGEVAGFGLLDAVGARAVATAASGHPRTRWCLTVLSPDGTAVAHGCAAGRHSWPAGRSCAEFVAGLRVVLNTVIRGRCGHARAERGYRPSRRLRHLVTARNTRCTAPGCSRPAARCDLDHTLPWHEGGVTCECNLSPLCRHHHKCKQSDGWMLEQPSPGVLVWVTPAGRHYVTQATVYAA